jgi:cytochrome-b5 reductase
MFYVVKKYFLTEESTLNKSVKKNSTSVLDPNEFRKFKLIYKKNLTVGEQVKCPVKLFRFELPSDKSLELPVGKHISIVAKLKNSEGELEEVKRSYTPTSSNDDKGFFDLVIKIYPKGKMTQFLDHLKVNEDEIEVLGPKGLFTYKKNEFKKIGMIAGGTGITPCLQVIEHVLKDKTDKTELSLLYGNITEDDIILRDVIDELAKKHDNFKVYHVLNEAPENWNQGKGFITKEMIEKHLLVKGSSKQQFLMCGPPPMIKFACVPALKELGFEDKDHVTF